MTQAILPYGRQWLDDDDIRAVVETLKSDWLTQGPMVAEFEEAVASYSGVAHAVAFSNGTAALHAAAFAAGVGPGDEIVTSPLSFAASANGAVYMGAVPRFADVEPGGFNLDPARLAKVVGPKTKAVIPVDFSGHPADIDAVRAAAPGAVIIEDAAHSLGAEYKGRRIGSQADMTALSFHPVKLITSGEGGMVLTPRADLRDRLLRFRTHGIVRPEPARQAELGPWFYEMVDLGFNYRLTDFQCALGLSQLRKLDGFLARRRSIAARYDAAFAGHPLIKTLPTKPWAKSAYHLYCLQIDFERLGKTRIQVMSELNALGVGSQVHYIPIPWHPYYRERFGYQRGEFPEAERFYERALSIPMYPKLSDSEVERVVSAVGTVAPR